MPITIIKSCDPVQILSAEDKKIKPLTYSNEQALKELMIADRDAQEHTRQVGTKIKYFQLDIKYSKIDPLYDEPIEPKYSGAFNLYAYVSWPNPEFMVRDDGVHTVMQSAVWIARKEAEDVGLNKPKPGDIILFWDIPYFRNVATNGREIDGASMFFDVIEVKDDGHLYDTPYFVGFKIDIKRKTEFGAERKLLLEL